MWLEDFPFLAQDSYLIETPQTNILPGYSPDPLHLKVQHAQRIQSQLVTKISICFYNYLVTGSYFCSRGEL